MNCEVVLDTCPLDISSRHEIAVTIPSRVLIEGPQGAGKTSLAEALSKEFGTLSKRGFPIGQEIVQAKTHAQLCRRSIELTNQPLPVVQFFDRCPISQYAYLYRKTEDPNYLDCARKTMTVLSFSGPILLLFIEAEATTLYLRQNHVSTLSIGLAEQQREIQAYSALKQYLSAKVPSNVEIATVQNGLGISQEGFIEASLVEVRRFLQKKT